VTGTGSTDGGCIFCDAHAYPERPGSNDLILIRGRATFVILNLYPYNSGHLMVVPARHVASLARTTAEEQAELMRFTRHAEIALTEVYTPQGLNIGVNLGRPAGAGVLDHLHVHVVPRWNGDTNFMSVIGETRVLPEDLNDTAKRLRPVFERLSRTDV
jgi:ATP adenylyltransferase